MSLDPLVRAAVDSYLLEAAGLIDGLYLFGSVALRDFRPGQSDIDFLAVTADRLDSKALAALESLHATLPGPRLEGLYVTREELAAGPSSIRPTPYVRDRRLHPSGDFEHTPVTWHTLAERGVHCHGPALNDLEIWTDQAVLAAKTRENLATYWRGQLDLGSRCAVEPYPGTTMWVVLGAPRLHYTLATGKITSKTGAGRYALRTFDERWHPLIEACLAQRDGGDAPAPEHWPGAMDFLALVIDSARRLP